jgi:hypothetical protein
MEKILRVSVLYCVIFLKKRVTCKQEMQYFFLKKRGRIQYRQAEHGTLKLKLRWSFQSN